MRLPVYFRKRVTAPIHRAEKKSGWDKAAVVVQAIGAFAIFVSLAGLFIGVRQFNEQQRANAVQQTDQQDEATLVQYLNDMSALMLTHHLNNPDSPAPIRALAVARTLTAVRDLDGGRKGTLVRFLWGAHLINRPQPILKLLSADLNGTVFANAILDQIHLSKLGLISANFAGARLLGAYLQGSVLIQSNFEHANLACYSPNVCTDLRGAHLMRADLIGADLSGADLTGADLSGADLSSANLAGIKLQKAIYNARSIPVRNPQGDIVTDMPTRWPKGFNPTAAGATCQKYC